MITCDARSSSNLDWSPLRASALSLIAKGEKILWHLDFGLFDQLQKPLENPGQFANFALAIDHFQDKLWREFHKFSLGVVLYKGNADYSTQMLWNEQQQANFSAWMEEREVEESDFTRKLYLRDVCADYLEQLSKRLKAEISPHIIFDKLPEDPLFRALLTDPESYGNLLLNENWKVREEKEIGVYMPSNSMVKPACLTPYQGIFEKLKGQEYKLIPESQLITSWQGLNVLYYHPEAISSSGHRKIQGFIAAGGETVQF